MNPSICESPPLISNWCPSINPSNTQLTQLRILRYNSSYTFTKCFPSKSSSPLASAAVKAVTAATQDDELQQPFLVSYLIDSCGLSPQRAVDVSRIYSHRLRFDSPEKPDSMLTLFRNNGFTDDDITKLISADPILLSSSEETLLPKIQFLDSIGFTKEELPTFLFRSGLLKHSLKDYIIPLYSMLKDVVGPKREIVVCLKRLGFELRKSAYKNMGPNLVLLKEIGVPSSKLGLLVRTYPKDLLIQPDEFRVVVDDVKAWGFNVTKSLFVLALRALSPNYITTRYRCSKIYMEWGFSQKDIIAAFMKRPQCMLISENKLRDSLEFLISEMGCQVKALACSPVVLTLSLEERIIPRSLVILVLTKKGLVKKDLSLLYVLRLPEKIFLDRYVHKHTVIASLLLDMYYGKVDPFKESYILVDENEL